MLAPPAGFEPTLQAPEACVLSVKLRELINLLGIALDIVVFLIINLFVVKMV